MQKIRASIPESTDVFSINDAFESKSRFVKIRSKVIKVQTSQEAEETRKTVSLHSMKES